MNIDRKADLVRDMSVIIGYIKYNCDALTKIDKANHLSLTEKFHDATVVDISKSLCPDAPWGTMIGAIKWALITAIENDRTKLKELEQEYNKLS